MSRPAPISDAEKILTVWVALNLKRAGVVNRNLRRFTGRPWPTVNRWQRELMPDRHLKPAEVIELMGLPKGNGK